VSVGTWQSCVLHTYYIDDSVTDNGVNNNMMDHHIIDGVLLNLVSLTV